jgi:hypothetical protein
MSRAVWLPVFVAVLTGCAAPTLYSWGQYEELIYVTYTAPGKAAPEMQIEKLEQDYQETVGPATPRPGWRMSAPRTRLA